MYRKYHSKFKVHVLTIFAGEYYVSSKQEILCTVLGSCISVCLFDKKNSIGGFNHFMLPDAQNTDDVKLQGEQLIQRNMRYGISSMEMLISEMQKSGAERKNLVAKIFGGGNVLSRTGKGPSIGDKNIGFTRAYLKSEGIPIESEDVGSTYGRKIFYLTEKNAVFVKKVALEPAEAEERAYMKQLLDIKKSDESVTLF